MSDDLVERLKGHARQLRDHYAQGDGASIHLCCADDAEEAADHIKVAADYIKAQAAEIRSLREQVARARLEGAEVMREVAAENAAWPQGLQCYDEYERGVRNARKLIEQTIRSLDPAAILEAHTRAKATP
jgi:hypothetical protein